MNWLMTKVLKTFIMEIVNYVTEMPRTLLDKTMQHHNM